MKLRKIEKEEFDKYSDIKCADSKAYPLSILEGIQNGDIYAGDDAALFWHYCGFGYAAGEPSDEFLEAVYEDFIQPKLDRRFILITDDDNVIGKLSAKADVHTEKRFEFEYDEACGREKTKSALDGMMERNPNIDIVPVSAENINSIKGRIIPAFSWDSNEAFLEKGLGYAAMDKDRVVAVAFSSAVSSSEIDIGVETDPDYRGRGLAAGIAAKMCEAVIALGKEPIWACSTMNTASAKTAEKIGFVNVREKTVIRRGDI